MEDRSRSLYSHEEYISLVLNSGSGLSHDYVSQSIEEDPRMMAFFDSLVRREIEGWSSDSDSDLSEEAIMQLHARGRRSTRAASAAPVVASAADHRTDSDNSSSSSLAGPDASGEGAAGEDGEECPRRQRRRPQHQSDFLANEDSDSSEFWLDPMPRPRSPSPRENSTLSSPSNSPSLPAEASSSSTSTSSSSSDDEERRSAVRRQNVVRRRRMNVVSRAGYRPESIQALFSAIDSYNYPSISVDDLSTSSSDDEPNSPEIKPRGSASREEEKHLSPSEFVCLSPVMSPESQDNNGSDRTEQGGRSVASPQLPDELGSPYSREANDVSTVADDVSQSRRSPGVNGQRRPVTPSTQRASSESEDEIGTLAEEPRPQREKGLAQSALKRTHVGSEEAELGLSSSEKKLKT